MNDLIAKKKRVTYAVKSEHATGTIQDVDLNKRVVTGFYSTFKVFDSDCDVLMPNCAKRSIEAHGVNGTSTAKIKHLMHHNWTQIPGRITMLEERKVGNVEGVYFETKMAATQLGNDTLINYQEGVYDNHSIGFQFLDGEYIDNESESWGKTLQTLVNPIDAENNGFLFLWKEIRLWEGSTVAFGANGLTPYLGVKNMDNREALQLKLNERVDILLNQVKTGTQSDDMLQNLEMQLLQLKQIQAELYLLEPSAKDTLQQQARLKDNRVDVPVFDLNQALKTIKIIQ